MLVVPKFLNYEQPEGYGPGLPEVYVQSSLEETSGLPTVDYLNLRDLYTNSFGFDPDDLPILRLYAKFIDPEDRFNPKRLLRGIEEHGFRYGRTVHINVDTRTSNEDELTEIDSLAVMKSVLLHTAAFSAVRTKGSRVKPRDVVKAESLPAGIAIASALNNYEVGVGAGQLLGVLWGAVVVRDHRALVRSEAEKLSAKALNDHDKDIVWPYEYVLAQRELYKDT